MPSYLVTGASRGLGYEFLRQLASKPDNVVIGLVRNKEATDAKIASDSIVSSNCNVHIVRGDITDYASLENAVIEVSNITGGSLDHLIANASSMSRHLFPIGELGKDPVKLSSDMLHSFTTDVIGNMHLYNLFMPLILKSDIKKVIGLTTGLAEIPLSAKYQLELSAPYAIAKCALNGLMVKFHAQYAREGVLVMNISPGVVDTGNNDGLTEAEGANVWKMFQSFQEYDPTFKGPTTPELSVKDMLATIERASLANGDGGSISSHRGDGQWI